MWERMLFAFAFRIFLCFPLEVGSMRYFKKAAESVEVCNQERIMKVCFWYNSRHE
ncbi:hypothetical protein AB4Z29_20620 [Paenibacillus sp. 2TAB23]|uniref:hypothetical protein n=1 Tax=Paenibacillus sp. 2TAB23 TaxID=3233004 RepID=UPI003F9C4E0B